MSSNAQKRANEVHRQRLIERGFARFEVRGLGADKDLIRNIARCLATNDERAGELRRDLARSVGGDKSAQTGGVLAALRRSPLVGAELNFERDDTPGRDVGL